jgi:hypothetical protein
MDRNKKTVLYKYKNKSGEEVIGSINPKKASQVKKFNDQAIKKAKKKRIPIPEEENEEK